MIINDNIVLSDINHSLPQRQTAQRYLSYQRLMMAASHMEDAQDLDTRALHLTVTFQYGKPASLIKPLYQNICQDLTGKAFPKGPNRPGLIIHEDAAGSRYGSAHDYNRHVHGLVILPYQVEANGLDLTDIAKKLDTRLNADLRLQETRDAKVTAYDFGDHLAARSLSELDDYNNKLVRKTFGEGFNRFFVSTIYPYDLDRDNPKTTKANIRRMQTAYDDMLHRFQTNARSIFSERYLHAFETELLVLIRFGKTGRSHPLPTQRPPANDNQRPRLDQTA